jgi:GntR family transcriptional regulator
MDIHPRQFDIRPNSGVPIYRQIIDQVHALIAGGRLRPGDLLPSVRQVARGADINPMTVSKAYSRLEADGLVERIRGQGMRIIEKRTTDTRARRRKQLRELLAPALHRAVQLGLTEQEIRDVFRSLLEELTHEHARAGN